MVHYRPLFVYLTYGHTPIGLFSLTFNFHQLCAKTWVIFKGLFSIWQNFEPTLANFVATYSANLNCVISKQFISVFLYGVEKTRIKIIFVSEVQIREMACDAIFCRWVTLGKQVTSKAWLSRTFALST